MGGSFTIYIEGNLFRIAGKDGDAIGKEPLTAPEVPEDATEADIEAAVWQQMRTCYDPEIPINIVELGLVYECKIERAAAGARVVKVKMTLTAPGCGMGDILTQDVREKIEIDSDRCSSRCRARVRPAVEPRDDVRGSPTRGGTHMKAPCGG